MSSCFFGVEDHGAGRFSWMPREKPSADARGQMAPYTSVDTLEPTAETALGSRCFLTTSLHEVLEPTHQRGLVSARHHLPQAELDSHPLIDVAEARA